MSETTTLPINGSTDMLRDTQLVTAGYFTGGAGTLVAANIHSGSLSEANQEYYHNIVQTHTASGSAATQFSVAYGHYAGSGSTTDAGNLKGPSEVIYKQWANILLGPNEITGGFGISGQGTWKSGGGAAGSSGSMDEEIFVLVGKRSLFKDRINSGNWTIALSGSLSTPAGDAFRVPSGSGLLYLTDDSKTKAATSTVAGNRYNIVSGSTGAVASGSDWKTYGWFYPDMGVMVFSAAELSASIPGASPGGGAQMDFTASYDINTLSSASVSCSGFYTNTNTYDTKNSLRFINCLKHDGAYLKFRSEEEQNSVSYFCRVFSGDMNYTNNTTFVSGSQNLIRHEGMRTDPTVYITGINLYSGGGHLVATAKLSTPLKKNFGSEATIKVKLTY